MRKILLTFFIILPLSVFADPLPSTILDRAFKHFHKKKYQKAKIYFDRYLQVKGNQEVPLRYLGIIAFEQKDFEKSEDFFVQAIKSNPKSERAYLGLAEARLKLNKLEKAKTTLKDLLKQQPFNGNALYGLASIESQQGNARKSLSYYKRLLMAAERNENSTWDWTASEYLGRFYYHEGNYERSIKHYERLTKISPDNIKNYFILSELYKMRGRFEDARRLLELINDHSDKLPRILFSLAEVYFILDDSRASILANQIINDGHSSTLLKGIIQLRDNQYAAAEKSFTKVLKKSRSRLSAHIGLFRLRKLQNDSKVKQSAFTIALLNRKLSAYSQSRLYMHQVFVSLEKEAKKAGHHPLKDSIVSLKQKPLYDDFFEAYITHANIYRLDGKYRMALPYYRFSLEVLDKLKAIGNKVGNKKFIKKNLNRELNARLNLATCLYFSEKANIAYRELESLQSSFPTSADSYFLQGVFLMDDKESSLVDVQKAQEKFEKTLKLKGSRVDGSIYFYLGMGWDRLQKFNLAESSLKKAIELEPFNGQFLNFLGYSYSQRNIKLNVAKEYILRALEHDPENEAYLDSLGWILHKLGDDQGAVVQLKFAVSQAIKNKRVDPVIYFHLAEVLFSLKKWQLSKHYYSLALTHIKKSSEKLDRSKINYRLSELKHKKN